MAGLDPATQRAARRLGESSGVPIDPPQIQGHYAAERRTDPEPKIALAMCRADPGARESE
jgi:hypothetical protein